MPLDPARWSQVEAALEAALQLKEKNGGEVIALCADLTRDVVRTRAMAAIGMTIGATFAVSLVVAPALAPFIGVPGIFVMTGVLALGAIVLLERGVPDPAAPPSRHDTPAQWRRVLASPELVRLNYGIFALHAALMALFVQLPLTLTSPPFARAAAGAMAVAAAARPMMSMRVVEKRGAAALGI